MRLLTLLTLVILDFLGDPTRDVNKKIDTPYRESQNLVGKYPILHC